MFRPLLLALFSGFGALSVNPTVAGEWPPSANDAIIKGERIYTQGLRPSGVPLSATVRGDLKVSGTQFACISCHRRSGLGSSEGGVLVPPINGGNLFTARSVSLHQAYEHDGMRTENRPAYTFDTLARALRSGIDANGRELSPLMPRFHFSDDEVQAIAAYATTLFTENAPGVDEQVIHFATILTPGDKSEKQAMLQVYERFFADKNAVTRNEIRRAKHSPYHKEWFYFAYRTWQLHTWELDGPESTWPTQLQALYAEQPVFAVIGGMGDGDWQGIHRFCEATSLPCLLPYTDTPPASAEEDFYSVYFSRGVELEARTLAQLLSETGQPVLQIHRNDAAGRIAAGTLQQALAQAENDTTVNTRTVEARPDTVFWQQLQADYPHHRWVLWLDAGDLETLPADIARRVPHIYLSASMLDGAPPTEQQDAAFTLLSPYQLPGMNSNRLRFEVWARVRKIELSAAEVQAASFFTASLAGEALMHLHGNFSREYFIERIEHMMENMINTSPYPRLSLAQGQRFAVKGCYVWDMAEPVASAQWVVPR